MAKALGLSQDETDTLLSAGGFAPSTAPELALHPRDETLYRIAQELQALRSDPQIGPAQIRFVEEALLLLLRGARSALPAADLAVLPGGAPTARTLGGEERYLDDLLGDFIAGRPAARQPMPWPSWARWPAARAGSSSAAWPKRCPPCSAVDAERTVALMSTLRDDPPDPQWRTDIRRRVIEAAPALWAVQPEAVAPLLRWREGDEVYAALATLDVLADIGDAGADGRGAGRRPAPRGGQAPADGGASMPGSWMTARPIPTRRCGRSSSTKRTRTAWRASAWPARWGGCCPPARQRRCSGCAFLCGRRRASPPSTRTCAAP